MNKKNISFIPISEILLWDETQVIDPYLYKDEGIVIPGLEQRVLQKQSPDGLLSAGYFFWQGKPTFVAWGRESDAVCGQHAISTVDGSWSETIPGCPDFKTIRNEKNEAVGFSLGFNGDRLLYSEQGRSTIRGFESPSLSHKIKTFTPLIGAFGVVAIFTLGMSFFVQSFSLYTLMQFFMAGFFLLFGGLKALNLYNFAETYATYDLVAQKYKSYAYAYPFLELILGCLYLFNLYPNTTALVTFVGMSVGALGVWQALQQGQRLECACLGKFFSLPLTTVTLVENSAMAAMALLMIYGHTVGLHG